MTALSDLFDRYANLSPEPPCWIEGDDGGSSDELCRKCVAARPLSDDDCIVGGCTLESDSCVHCADCGKLLDYCLTDWGAGAELDHFRDVKFRRNKLLDRETAFHIARMLAVKGDDHEAVLVAARAIRAMKRIPKPCG